MPETLLFDSVLIKGFENIGYTCLTEAIEGDKENYMILAKGYNLNGTTGQVFHIHACPNGHEMLKQIAFRDYLRYNPKHAKKYEALKIKLASEFKNDRSGYRLAKTEFIKETLKLNKK